MNENGSYSFEVTEENFQTAVIEKSREVPVMVDFWAEWCAPCRMLTPVLEELVGKYQGKVLLAKLDVDQAPRLSAQFQIRGIPAVKIFVDGEVAREFVGVQPPAEVERILREILPVREDSRVEEAGRLLAGGRWEDAARLCEEVIQDEPDNSTANLGLGIIAFHQGRWDNAEEHLLKVDSDSAGTEDLPAMLARIYFEQLPAPDLSAATEKLKKDPRDLPALYSIALAYARGGEYEKALEQLLSILGMDREFSGGSAKEAFLKLVDIIGRGSEAGKKYTRRLSMILFS